MNDGNISLCRKEKINVSRLDRREILECLKRQGVQGLARIKTECRRFEHYRDGILDNRQAEGNGWVESRHGR